MKKYKSKSMKEEKRNFQSTMQVVCHFCSVIQKQVGQLTARCRCKVQRF